MSRHDDPSDQYKNRLIEQAQAEHEAVRYVAICSWCQPINTALNHTICSEHKAIMEAEIKAALKIMESTNAD